MPALPNLYRVPHANVGSPDRVYVVVRSFDARCFCHSPPLCNPLGPPPAHRLFESCLPSFPPVVPCRERPATDGGTAAPLLLRLLAVGWLIGGFLSVALVATVSVLNLHRPWGAAGAVLLAGLLLLPLRLPAPAWARRFLELSVAETRAWFPISVAFEDEAAFKGPAGPFVIGGCDPPLPPGRCAPAGANHRLQQPCLAPACGSMKGQALLATALPTKSRTCCPSLQGTSPTACCLWACASSCRMRAACQPA